MGDVARGSSSATSFAWANRRDPDPAAAAPSRPSADGIPEVPTRILLVDEHRLFAEAITSVLEDQKIDVVGIATTGDDAVAAARRTHPDLILYALGQNGSEWSTIGRRIREASPRTKIVALTEVRDQHLAADAIRAGFHGCLTKDIPIAKLFTSIRAALDGQVVLSPRIVRGAFDARPPDVRAAALLAEQITPREQDVLSLLVQGASSEEVARRLRVSPNTVRTHVQSIFTKLGVHSRLEATAFAVRYGLVQAATGTRGEDDDEPTVVIRLP